jgi:hypothetical protein
VTRALLLAAAVLLVAVAGCGGGGKSSAGATTTVTKTLTTTNPTGTAKAKFHYSDQLTQSYMSSCTASKNATRAYCQCTLDKLAESVSEDDFKRIALAGGKIPLRIRNDIVRAAHRCRDKL